MHIIFESPLLTEIGNKHTVLELDTFEFQGTQLKKTAWCVVENIPITEISTIDHYKKLHQELLINYRTKNWKFCEDAVALLKGRWGGELDPFYNSLIERIENFKQTPPDNNWSGTVVKPIMGLSEAASQQ